MLLRRVGHLLASVDSSIDKSLALASPYSTAARGTLDFQPAKKAVRAEPFDKLRTGVVEALHSSVHGPSICSQRKKTGRKARFLLAAAINTA
jgi:hypothetical protein